MSPEPDPAPNPETRMSWLTQPCPTWCVQPHQEDDFSEDRKHQSRAIAIPAIWLTTVAPEESADELVAGDLNLFAWQRIGSTETIVSLADDDYDFCLEITIESIRRLHETIGHTLGRLA